MHKPADEREQVLYQKAYRQSLNWLWISLAILAVLFYYTAAKTVNAGDIFLLALAVLIISYFGGWYVLRREELVYQDDELNRNFSSKKFWGALLVLYLYVVIAMAVSPQAYLIHVLILIFGLYLLMLIWAWALTKNLDTHIRIILSLIFPYITIPLFTSKNRHILYRLAKIVGFNFAIPISAMIFVGIVRLFLVSPIIIGTNAFEPELHEGAWMLVSKTDKTFDVNDYIVVNDNGPRVGRIIRQQNDKLLVKFASEEKSVNKHEIEGTLLTAAYATRILPK